MSRCLVKALIGNAKVSGRSGKDKLSWIPYKVEPDEFPRALNECVQNGSICPICGKSIDLSLGVQCQSDSWYINQDPQSPSCDRKVNGGTGYIWNNVRITHRNCNRFRKHQPLDFTWENLDWKPTASQARQIHLNNLKIIKNNFLVSNPRPIVNRNTMKNAQVSTYIELGNQLGLLPIEEQQRALGIAFGVYISSQNGNTIRTNPMKNRTGGKTIANGGRAKNVGIDVVKKVIKLKKSGVSSKEIQKSLNLTVAQVDSANDRLRAYENKMVKA